MSNLYRRLMARVKYWRTGKVTVWFDGIEVSGETTLFGYPVTSTSAPPALDLGDVEIGGLDDIGKPRSEWSIAHRLIDDSEGEADHD